MRAIPLDAAHPRLLAANPIAVLHPISYLPQIPILWLGLKLGLSPLVLFYAGRLAGLAAGIGLTWRAIRVAPFGKAALATLALLPTVLFGRSTFDADQLTNGIAFLFAALVLRERIGTGPIARPRLLLLATVAFLLAQAKTAYLLLPLFALAIPAHRFADARRRWLACVLIVMPGAIGSIAWAMALAHGPFAGAYYRTLGGEAFPRMQQDRILADPLAYLRVVLRTLIATPFLPRTLIELIGVFGPPVRLTPLAYPLLLVGLIGGIVLPSPNDVAARPAGRPIRLLAVALVLASVLIVLTFLYLQWNAVGAPTIDGFQGRYLVPMLPLLAVFMRPSPPRPKRPRAEHALILTGGTGLLLTLVTTWHAYLA